jgi:hypothetical protein
MPNNTFLPSLIELYRGSTTANFYDNLIIIFHWVMLNKNYMVDNPTVGGYDYVRIYFFLTLYSVFIIAKRNNNIWS